MVTNQIRWTVQDLEVMPDDWGQKRYESIDGELFVTRAPYRRHQSVASKLNVRLGNWTEETGMGEILQTPGLVFTESDAVIPDLVWASNKRLANGMDTAGHFVVAPELVVEVLSAGTENEQRDKKIKLKLYSRYGVQEYWVVNWRMKSIAVHRRQNAQLRQVKVLFVGDMLTSPLFPGFECSVDGLFIQ